MDGWMKGVGEEESKEGVPEKECARKQQSQMKLERKKKRREDEVTGQERRFRSVSTRADRTDGGGITTGAETDISSVVMDNDAKVFDRS
jgi:hypothetical protein